ncbi:disease resistance protein [Salix suchowensis]|nr:disease resistance protein [Salix suchowensis]
MLAGHELSLLSLETLCLRSLPDMRCIWKGLVLSHLTTLEVSHYSSQLLGVFWQDDDVSPVNVEKQMVFPNLSWLFLYKLPSIVCFSLGCDDFLFPRLWNPKVDKCPKLTTKFA